MIAGIFVGAILTVALFSIFLFGIMRDKTALWYAAYALTIVASEVLGGGVRNDLATILAFAAFLFFTRSFLRTAEQARRWDSALIACFCIYAVLQIGHAFAGGADALTPALRGAELLAMLVTVVAGVFRLRSGYAPARYFVLGFMPLMIGVFASVYSYEFTAPGIRFWAANGVEIGTLIQATIISFSVIDRLRILQHEQHRTRSELTAISAHAQKMQSLALLDPLTGLANRISFTEELERALTRYTSKEHGFAVLFCDLDGFKEINDRFGHRVGDDVLRIVAKRLSGSLRERDLIARLGGDEFAVLLEFVSTHKDAEHIAEMVAALLEDPITIDGTVVPLGISVGHAVFPLDGHTIDELLHEADLRMYEIKASRRSSAS